MKKTLALLLVLASGVALLGCHAGRMRTTYPPTADNFTKLEAGAKKVGWRTERQGEALTVFPPDQEMVIDTAPEINSPSIRYPSSVGVKCKTGSWDECKKLFDQISVGAGMGQAKYQ